MYSIRTKDPSKEKKDAMAKSDKQDKSDKTGKQVSKQTENNLPDSRQEEVYDVNNANNSSSDSIKVNQKKDGNGAIDLTKTAQPDDIKEQKRLKELFDAYEQEIGDFVSRNFGYDAQISIDDFKK